MTTQKTQQRQAARMEARVSKMLSLLAREPLYREDLARAMGLSEWVLKQVVRYAKDQNWIISQGRYYINPRTVFVADGQIVRDYKMEAVK